jgi:Zn ribbon nucleic-acid-binding protein
VFLAVTSKSKFIAGAHCPRYSGERRNTISELEASVNQVQVGQKTYQMPPKDGITVAHFLTVADIERFDFTKRSSVVAF